MPLFEYKCESCGHRLEVLQKHDDPPPVCEQCTEEMARLVSASSFRLEGSGWARDSYGLNKGEG